MKNSLLCCAVFLLLLLLVSPALAASGYVDPFTPVTVAGYDLGRTDVSRFRITGVEFEFKEKSFGRVDLTVTLHGQKTFDRDGNTAIRFSSIRVAIYDENGIWTAADNVSTGGAWVGSSLFSASVTFYGLKSGKYTIDFPDALADPPLLGDVNGDGTVDGRDVLRLARYFAGYPVQIDSAAADLTGDGSLDGRDLLRLAKRLAGG